MVGNYQCWLTPTTRCSANRNLNVSKQQMCKIALTLAVALFSRTAKFPPRWEASSSEGLRVRDKERLRVTCMAWCMHAYVHLLRRRHRGNLTSPAVIDRSGRTLVSRILGGHHVSMAMSGALPISATYTDAARRGNGRGGQQEAPHRGDQRESLPPFINRTAIVGFT